VPEAVWTEATKARVDPKVKEALVAGVRLMRPGKIGGPGLVPPHPARLQKLRIATAKHRPREQNLPMHPSQLFEIRPESIDAGENIE
jgi:hypothetical protein